MIFADSFCRNLIFYNCAKSGQKLFCRKFTRPNRKNPKVGICHFSGANRTKFGLEFSLGMLHTFLRQIPTRKLPNP